MNSGPAVGIARIVERVDADDDVVGAEHLGPAERERQEHGVARRHVGRGNLVGSIGRSFGTGRSLVSDEPPNADRSTSISMCRATPSAPRDRARRLDLARVALAVADGQRVQAEPVAPARCAAAVYESSPPLSRTTASFTRRGPLSDAARVRVPDVLVQLQLHAHRQAVGEHPLRQRARVHHAVHRRKWIAAARGRQIVRARSRRARTRSRRGP